MVMESESETPGFSLHELIDPASCWQKLQDHFSQVLGIPIRTISPSRDLLMKPSWPASLHADKAIELLKVGEELEMLIPTQESPRESTTITTPLGVSYSAVPIRATHEAIAGYFIVGPLMVGRREDEVQFCKRVSAMERDPQELWPLILSLKLYTFAGLRSVLNLMEEVGSALAQFAYQIRHLSAIMPSSVAVDKAVLAYHTERILQSLLDVATLATRADGGSILVVDENEKALRIKVAKGLSKEVVAATRLKPREGIAGLAVSERSVFLLDSQTEDERLKRLMRRPELVSSIVAPLTLDSNQAPVGVLSLRTANPEKRFTNEGVEIVRKLLDLASAALAGLDTALNPTQISST